MSDAEIYNLFAAEAPDPATVDYALFETKTDPSVLGANYVQTNTGTIRLLTRDIDSWCLPHEAVLRVKFQLSQLASAAAPLATTMVALTNGGWHIFRDLQINLNGKMIDRVDLPGKVQIMKAYAQDANIFDDSTCDNSWFYPEVAARTDFTTLAGAARQNTKFVGAAQPLKFNGTASVKSYAQDAFYNESFRRRYQRLCGDSNPPRAGQEVELWLKLSDVSGFCEHIDKVIRGVSFEVVLNRDTDWNRIIHRSKADGSSSMAVAAADASTDNAADCKLIVNEVSMWMPRLVPSQAVASALEAQLAASAQTKYMFENATCYQSEIYTAQNGSRNIRWKIVSEAHRPVMALIGFQAEYQYSQQYDGRNPQYTMQVDDVYTAAVGSRPQNGVANKSLFSRLGDITQVEMRVNQRIVPTESYRISFADESAVRAFHDFRRAYNKDDPRISTLMSWDTWRESPIFAIDLSMIGDENIYGGVKTNDIELRATLVSADSAETAYTFKSGDFQVFCVLFTEVEMKVDAVNGRLVYVP